MDLNYFWAAPEGWWVTGVLCSLIQTTGPNKPPLLYGDIQAAIDCVGNHPGTVKLVGVFILDRPINISKAHNLMLLGDGVPFSWWDRLLNFIENLLHWM